MIRQGVARRGYWQRKPEMDTESKMDAVEGAPKVDA